MANANSTDFIGAGQEALRQGRFTDAERWLGQALQTAPATAELLFLYSAALAQTGVRFYALDRPTSIQATRNTYRTQLGDFALAKNAPSDAAALVSQLDLLIAGDNRMAATAAAPGIPAWVMLPADAPAPRARGAAIRLFRRTFGDDWRAVVEQIDRALAAALAPARARAS